MATIFNPRTPRGVRPGPLSPSTLHPVFNPRTPRGVRLMLLRLPPDGKVFQSTHPARGATMLRP